MVYERYSEGRLPRGRDGASVRRGFSARRGRVEAIPGAFERQSTVPKRMPHARRCWRRLSREKGRKLRFERHGERARGRWSAEGCKARRWRAGVIKGALGRKK